MNVIFSFPVFHIENERPRLEWPPSSSQMEPFGSFDGKMVQFACTWIFFSARLSPRFRSRAGVCPAFCILPCAQPLPLTGRGRGHAFKSDRASLLKEKKKKKNHLNKNNCPTHKTPSRNAGVFC